MEDSPKLAPGLAALYDGYYGDAATETKRGLAAIELGDHLQQLVGNETFAAIIDVGAGQGSFVQLLSGARRAERIVAAEVSSTGVAAIAARRLQNVEVTAFDGYRLPFPDKSFDLATCLHVLEHVEHERLFLREIARVARRAVIEVPLEHTVRVRRAIRAAPIYGHINHYSRATFLGRLETTGLKVERSVVNAASAAMEHHLYGPLLGSLKHLARVSALSIAPALAPALMVYNCTALVDCG